MRFRKYLSGNSLNEDIKSKLNRLKNLSSREREILLKFFKNDPAMENPDVSGIDWNNKNLTFDDFKDILKKRSPSKLKRDVKKHGLAGLKKDVDYVDVSYLFSDFDAYIPLNFEASQMFGSRYIGRIKCEGKWCTSSNRPATWNDYTARGVVIVIIINKRTGEKYAVATHDRLMDVEIYDKNNKEIKNVKDGNSDVVSIVRMNKRDITKWNSKIEQYFYKNVKWLKKAEVMDPDYEITKDNRVIWHDGAFKGVWVIGDFHGGVIQPGSVWRDGNFYGDVFLGDTWEYGKFHGGVFRGKEWISGDFYDGEFLEGSFKYGIFHEGTFDAVFEGGAWVDGIWGPNAVWKGGLDRYRHYHPEGDSPDKWDE